MSKYNEVMNRIELTEDMQNRILNNIKSYQKKKRSGLILRYVYVLAACLILTVGIVLAVKASKIKEEPNEGLITQGGYDYKKYDNVEKLSDAFGVKLTDLQDLPFTVDNSSYSIMFDEFAQIDYYGKNDADCCSIRVGKDKRDISGDYNAYSIIKSVKCNSKTVTLKGNENKIYLAYWVSDGRFYSVSVQMGVDEDGILDIIRQIP